MRRILYISSEAFPLIKTGGLADVAGSLPAALLKQSQDVRILLPAYKEVLQKISKKMYLQKHHITTCLLKSLKHDYPART